MKAELLKRLFKGIFREDLGSLKKIANIVIHEERQAGHRDLADSLERIGVTETPVNSAFKDHFETGAGLSSLPISKRDSSPLVSFIPHGLLKHEMVLSENVEKQLSSIEQEFAARELLAKYNLPPKRKILLHGMPGCGKTLAAERIAWNLNLPFLKARFDALLSSYFGESASNLRAVFDYCQSEPAVLLLDECDFVAKSRLASQDVGEVPRIVNMLLTLLDEYNAPGLVIATTNLKTMLDDALFRRFDEIIEIPMPLVHEREELLRMTLTSTGVPIAENLDFKALAGQFAGYSHSAIVLAVQQTVKNCVLAGNEVIRDSHFAWISDKRPKF